ncbi:unnamed protein product, partial [Adineta steineri]
IEHLACIAVVNSPRRVTISGDEKTIDEIQQILTISYPNVSKARLRIENAFHSYQMNRVDIEQEMLSLLKDIRGLPIQDQKQIFDPICAKAKLYSSVIAAIIKDEAANVFLEISPHSVLATSIRECYELTNQQQSLPLILLTLKRKENEQITLLTSLAQLTTSSHVWQQYFHTRQILPMKNHEEYFDNFSSYKFHLSSSLAFNEHELIEVFTQIIMPMREWYIMFCNKDNFDKYLLNEFILHAQDKIYSKQQKSLTIPDTWTTQDITNAYQYGSSFEKLKTLHGISTTIISQLSNDNNNCSSSYLLHSFLVLLPGIETTFLPVSLQEFIYSSRIKTKMNQSTTNVEVRGKYHNNICGIGQEGVYTLDLWTFPMDNKIEEPVFTFESIILQQVQGAHSGRWSMKKTIYDKLNRTTDLPNTDHKKYLNTIVKDYLTWHSTQLRLIQLIKHFPRLEPFLITLNKYGSHLKDILSESSSSDDNNRSLNNIQQWTTLVEQIEGFNIIESTLNQTESTLIISQKTTSNEILQRLDERKNQTWLIFTKDDNNNKNSFSHILSSLLPCSNTEIFAFKQNEELLHGTFSHIFQIIQKPSLQFYPFVYVLTDHAQFNNDSNLNLIASPFIGLARSLITEYERNRLKLIDLQTSLNNNNQSIFLHILIEYMINSRYSTDTCQVVLPVDDEQEKAKLEQISIIPKRDADQIPFRICVAQSRFLSELTWIEEDRQKELLPGMVEVRVHCVGINFRDVLKSRGLYPYTRTFVQSDENQPRVNQDTEPGSDFDDTIVRACPTTNFQVDDHVIDVTDDGAYHSRIMINSQLIIRIPSDSPLTDEQLCGLPYSILTVTYSLKYRVHLQADQTILIHAATGAAGQWCIQYCQYISARVIATARTEEKRCFLREYYGIEHVFNSRDTSFVNDVRQILPQGVDVIVNSLSGNLLKESIKLLACHGHFVEWSKRDIYHNNILSIGSCITSYSSYMFVEAIDLFAQRKLRAVEPTVTYEPSQVIEALLRCNSGQVMGKTVFRITSSDQPLTINKKQSTAQTDKTSRTTRLKFVNTPFLRIRK